jgi:hypothetical protein
LLVEPDETRADPQSSLQANRKTGEGSNYPGSRCPISLHNGRVREALAAGEPAISIDTKKQEEGVGRRFQD